MQRFCIATWLRQLSFTRLDWLAGVAGNLRLFRAHRRRCRTKSTSTLVCGQGYRCTFPKNNMKQPASCSKGGAHHDYPPRLFRTFSVFRKLGRKTMRNTSPLHYAFAALFAIASGVHAAPINKCVINGSVTYQQEPCPSSQARKDPTLEELNAAERKRRAEATSSGALPPEESLLRQPQFPATSVATGGSTAPKCHLVQRPSTSSPTVPA